MRFTKYDRVLIKYMILFIQKYAQTFTEKDIWMEEHQQYLLNKIKKMEEKEEAI